jgi:hypothetical protein
MDEENAAVLEMIADVLGNGSANIGGDEPFEGRKAREMPC